MSDFKILRADEAPDYTGDGPGAFLGYGRPLGSGQLGFNVVILPAHRRHGPPNMDPAIGHSHREVEELYFVADGEVTVKAGDEVTTLGPRDAILIAPGTPRAVRNESDADAMVVMVSRRVDDPHAEVDWHEGFWPVQDA